jgi:hypothetical protein
MFCPQCRYEYRPEVTKCPDCDIWLVRALPAEPTSQSTDELDETPLEVVYSTFEYPRIQIASAILEEAGIPFLMNDQPIHGILRAPVPGKDPFELVVRADDVEQAAQLLEGIDDLSELPAEDIEPGEMPSETDDPESR